MNTDRILSGPEPAEHPHDPQNPRLSRKTGNTQESRIEPPSLPVFVKFPVFLLKIPFSGQFSTGFTGIFRISDLFGPPAAPSPPRSQIYRSHLETASRFSPHVKIIDFQAIFASPDSHEEVGTVQNAPKTAFSRFFAPPSRQRGHFSAVFNPSKPGARHFSRFFTPILNPEY